MAQQDNGGRNRAIIFLAVALIAGLAATVVIYQLIQGYQAKIAAAEAENKTITAVIASRTLFQGIPITHEDLVRIDVIPEFIPGGEKAVYLDEEQIIGRVPKERILANEFIREDRLADAETGVGLNALIPARMRAISISVKDAEALSGFLNPGNYVDVVVTLYPDEGEEIPETKTLVQAVYVLAVNDKMGEEKKVEEDPKAARKKKPKKIKPTVTLAVTPEQAEAIAQAEATGEISLSLRNMVDLKEEELAGVKTDNVLGKEEPPPPPPPEPKKVSKVKAPEPPPVVVEPQQTLQIIQGNKVTTQPVNK